MPTQTQLGADVLRALPPDAVLAHVGLPKTGTTALQAALSDQRATLTTHGVCYPGRSRNHQREAFSVIGTPPWEAGALPGARPPSLTPWRRLAAKVSDAPGRVVLSSERFNDGRGIALERFVEDLGPSRLHVILGLRHIGPVATSIWQQSLKRGRSWTLERWLESVYMGQRHGRLAESFWNRYAYGDTIERWVELVGAERVHVVVIEESDRTLQLQVFERLLGLPADVLSGSEPRLSNRSLTAAEAEAVRRANQLVTGQPLSREYQRVLTVGALARMVEQRRPGPDEAPITLPEWAFDVANDEGRLAADRIRALGISVYGDLDALTTTPVARAALGAARTATTTTVPVEALAEALAGALVGAVRGRSTFEQGSPQAESGLVLSTGSRDLLRVVARRARRRGRSLLQRQD